MFKSFYGLTKEPFPKDLDVKNHFKSNDFDEALNRLNFLKNSKGFGLLSGDPGVGKSFVLRSFVDSLNPNLFKSVYIAISSLTVMDFYRALADGLGFAPAHKKIDMFKQIQKAIFNYHNNKNITPVIIIDEAQFLKNSILDDLRLIFNFDMDSKDYAILILSGQLPFVSQINRQTHEALRQRIVVNYSMKGLSRDESRDYIVSRLKLSGSTDPVFTDSAFELIFTSTNGYLRKINTLAKMSLIEGANQKNKSIDNDIVFQVLNEIDISA